ncbi:unnamed protein product, partial [Dracunculus medinensis]|uniref:G-protein alpha subunit n=1 Tax=Dracunculus medinensis TaxID=318479 RepID=A0A0N4U4N1_DRAME
CHHFYSGAAESGKSTVFEQIRNFYNQDYTEFEFLHRKTFIFENIFASMRAILDFMKSEDVQFANSHNQVISFIKPFPLIYLSFSSDQLRALKDLWNDEAVQKVYERRAEFNLNDSTKYFFDSLDRINSSDFVPTPRDLIMAYCPTTGIQSISFAIDRKKWNTTYDDVRAVLFCIAVSEYDQTMTEDGVTNRLHDALSLLEHTCAEPKLQSALFFIFLNEIDVLAEKLTKVPLKQCLPDKCSAHPHSVFVEFTCAIDMEKMKSILDDTFAKIINK